MKSLPSPEPRQAAVLARLQGVGLVSNVDRYVSASMLVTLTRQFQAPLTQVAMVTSGHLLAYGVSQLPWSGVLARRGPVRVMRMTLVVAGASACSAALAPDLGWLVVARVIGGAFLAPAVPTALLYVGTRLQGDIRRRGFEGIVSANGIGIVLAVAIASVATATNAWRLGYLVSGIMLTGCGLLTSGLQESVTHSEPRSGMRAVPAETSTERDGGHLGRTLRVMSLVFVEGAVVVGAVLVLPALAEAAGQVRVTSAATLAVYGLAMPLTRAAMRRLPLLTTLTAPVRSAALLLCALPLLLVVCPPIPALLTTAALLGAAWSILHPALQDAATRSWPSRTPTVLALFVSALFLGGATGTQAFAALAEGSGTLMLAVGCTAGAVLLILVERLSRSLT